MQRAATSKRSKGLLDFADQLCQADCSAASRAKIAAGKATLLAEAGKEADAIEAFRRAVELDKDVALFPGRDGAAVKAAFDPLTLLNPGKAVPTLTRCAEIGGMHVHRGNLPFPDIERF